MKKKQQQQPRAKEIIENTVQRFTLTDNKLGPLAETSSSENLFHTVALNCQTVCLMPSVQSAETITEFKSKYFTRKFTGSV